MNTLLNDDGEYSPEAEEVLREVAKDLDAPTRGMAQLVVQRLDARRKLNMTMTQATTTLVWAEIARLVQVGWLNSLDLNVEGLGLGTREANDSLAKAAILSGHGFWISPCERRRVLVAIQLAGMVSTNLDLLEGMIAMMEFNNHD